MSMKITGILKVVFDKQTFDSGFAKREFVVTTQEQYPQDIKFELLKDKADKITVGDTGKLVDVHFDIRGNEYNGKYYNNLIAWKWEFQDANATPEPSEPVGNVNEAMDGTGDDMPF